jgi:glycosyltransferase involved in cell wall biosynthesis
MGVSFHHPIPALPLLKRYFGYLIRRHSSRFQYFYGRFLDMTPLEEISNVDLVVVNEIEYLPWLMAGQRDLQTAPTYLDLHEDHINNADRGALETFAFRKYWKWQLEKTTQFVKERSGHLVITSVEELIASSYSKLFSEPVQLIYNAPDPNRLQAIPLESDAIRLVHHGMGTKGRGIEETIRALRLLDSKFSLDLVLFCTPLFRLKIEVLSRILGVRKRVNVLPGVPLDELPILLNGYDIAVILISGRIPGHLNTLPNKLFESIHSKLAIVTGPNPSMSKIVTNNKIGVSLTSWSFRELAGMLSKLTAEDINTFKQNASLVAPHFSSERGKRAFGRIVHKLTGITIRGK